MKSKIVDVVKVAETISPAITTEKKLTFAEVLAISPPDDCPFEKVDLKELPISNNKLRKIRNEWNARNEIDGDGGICLSDDFLAQAARWYLRYLDIDFAVRKTRTDEVYAREVLETEATYARLVEKPSSLPKPILKKINEAHTPEVLETEAIDA